LPEDYLRVLELLRSKTVTITPNSALIEFNSSLISHYPEGGTVPHNGTSSVFLAVNEIDTLKATDASVMANLAEAPNSSSIQITRYNSTTTPWTLTPSNGLGSNEKPLGKYLNVTPSRNLQNATRDIIDSALIQFYYRESDLDRTGNGASGDINDLRENSLAFYFFNETSLQWVKLSLNLSWVMDFGVNTTDIVQYGEHYAGCVWALVSHFSLYSVAGLTNNNPPNTTNAYPSQFYPWSQYPGTLPVTIQGVTDPEGDPVSITITGIESSRPLKPEDAYGIGTDTAHLRISENKWAKVYLISFTASDGNSQVAGKMIVILPYDLDLESRNYLESIRKHTQ